MERGKAGREERYLEMEGGMEGDLCRDGEREARERRRKAYSWEERTIPQVGSTIGAGCSTHCG